jgi:hypothetical protein
MGLASLDPRSELPKPTVSAIVNSIIIYFTKGT